MYSRFRRCINIKYIKIHPIHRACKFRMYWQDLDVLCLYWGCIRCIRCILIVFGMYCASILGVLELRINWLSMVIAGILTGFHWRMYWNHQCQQIQHEYILNTSWLQFQCILKPEKTCIIQIQYISITSKQSIVHHDQAWVHLTLHHSIHPSLSHYIMIRVSLHPIILALITSHWHHIGYHSLSLSSTAAQPLAVWLAGHCRGCRVGHHYCRARSTAGRGDTAGPGETAGRGDTAGPPAKLEVSISSFASGNLKSLAASSGNRAASHGDWASIAYL